MSKPFNYGAEPFQGFTEFDEWESMDEFIELGEEEFGDLERFSSNFDLEEFDLEAEEEVRRRLGSARGGRRIPHPQGRRAMKTTGRRPRGRPRRPRPRPPKPSRPRRRRPLFGAYSMFKVPQPAGDMEPGDRGPEQATDGGTCPSVGRYGNWFKSGDQLIILLEEDAARLDQNATAAGAINGASGAPNNGGPEAAPEAPSERGSDGPTEATQGELADRGRLSRRRLTLIQHALNHLQGLRLPPNGFSNPQMRSALRSYQQQKGLTPHGQANYETELALASDIASVQRDYESEFGGDPCIARCFDIFNDCIRRSTSPLNCLARLSTCQRSCGSEPPIPIPPVPVPPTPCPPRPTLRLGSRGPAVAELQRRLNSKGATPRLDVDGIFGPVTSAAVRGFQRSRGLTVDGIVGPKTWAALGC